MGKKTVQKGCYLFKKSHQFRLGLSTSCFMIVVCLYFSRKPDDKEAVEVAKERPHLNEKIPLGSSQYNVSG